MVRRIGEALESNPWIRRVKSVERVYPDKVRVRFEYRTPSLAVRTAKGFILVDEELVRLPGQYPDTPDDMKFPEIVGVPGAPPKAGRVWTISAMRAGREMAEICASWPTLRALEIRSVDVSNEWGNILLQTGNGCAIHWGRAPGSAGRGEPTVEQKIAILHRVLDEHPNLDDLEAVRVFGGHPTVQVRDDCRVRNR
ncbi:MAG: cell division protein FtsQ/DivIB [Planctomycetota bacterium]|jgi:hypothetical protein